MGLRDWDIFGEIAKLRRDIDRFSRNARLDLSGEPEGLSWTPLVDIHEQDDAIVVLVDLPGVKRGEIDLRVDREGLTLEGERPPPEADGGIRLERPAGRFRRSFRIAGIPIDPSGAEATYRDGVLRIRIPRARRDEVTKRRVEVD